MKGNIFMSGVQGGINWIQQNTRTLTGYIFTERGKIEKGKWDKCFYDEPIGCPTPDYSLFETKEEAKKALFLYLKNEIREWRRIIREGEKRLRKLEKLIKGKK